jgi:hypothetical protein
VECGSVGAILARNARRRAAFSAPYQPQAHMLGPLDIDY